MNKGSNNRRSRGRGGNKRHGNVRNQSFESNGPGVKVRGTAQQVLDKYLALARDASSSGDRIAAESYFQFAEHYFRLLNSEEQRNNDRNQNRNKGNGRDRLDTPGGAEGGPDEFQEDAESGSEAQSSEAQSSEAQSSDAQSSDAQSSDAQSSEDGQPEESSQDKAPRRARKKNNTSEDQSDGSGDGDEAGAGETAAQELPGFITQAVDGNDDGDAPKRGGRGRRRKADDEGGQQETDAAD